MAGSESPLRDEWLTPEAAAEAYLDFEADFSPGHALLARHAAFPLILSPELVNLIWINFADREDVPWIAGPDFLLSRLCRPVGDGLYQVDPNAREVMLVDLVDQEADGARRLLRLADFLLAYVRRQSWLTGRPDVLRAYRWIAWSYLAPDLVVDDMVKALQATMAGAGGVARPAAAAGQRQVVRMLELVRTPLEFSLAAEKLQDLAETADFLVTTWYPALPKVPQAPEPGARPNSLLEEVAADLRRQKATRAEAPSAVAAASSPAMQGEGGRYADLEIRILPQEPDGYPVEITVNGQRAYPRVYLDPGRLQPPLPAESTYADEQGVEWLFSWLFSDGALSSAWAETRDRWPRRRIRLRSDDPSLSWIPWEQLREPAGPHHPPLPVLSAHPDTPFSRYVPTPQPPPAPSGQRPIRVLAAIASPAVNYFGTPPIDIEAEWQSIQEALAGQDVELNRILGSSENVSLPLVPESIQAKVRAERPIGPATLEALEAKLRNGYEVLHFVGRGYVGASDPAAGGLVMENGQGGYQIVGAADLAAMLARLTNAPQLVFLAAGQAAGRSQTGGFGSLGSTLVAAGVPAVVMVPGSLPVEGQRRFTSTFYRALLSHGLVDLAANEARGALLAAGQRVESLPVLFTSLGDGRLFVSLESETAAEEDVTEQAAAKAREGDVEGAMAIARAVAEPGSRAVALVGILPYLPEEMHTRVADEALAAASAVPDETQRLASLKTLAIVLATHGLDQDVYDAADTIADPFFRTDLLIGVAKALGRRGEKPRVAMMLKHAGDTARRVELVLARAALLEDMGRAYDIAGDAKQAISHFKQALRLYRQDQDALGKAMTLNELGSVYSRQGDLKGALDAHMEARDIAESAGKQAALAAALNGIGSAYLAMGEPEPASNAYNEALVTAERDSNTAERATALEGLGAVYAHQGDEERAAAAYRDALEAWAMAGNTEAQARLASTIGKLLSDSGKLSEALTLFEEVQSRVGAAGDRVLEAKLLLAQAGLLDAMGEPETALARLEEGRSLLEQAGVKGGVAQTLVTEGQALHALGRLGEAVSRYEQAIDLYRALGEQDGELEAMRALATSLADLGDLEPAEQTLRHVVQVDRRLKSDALDIDRKALADVQARRKQAAGKPAETEGAPSRREVEQPEEEQEPEQAPMPPEPGHTLQWFVDRERELHAFSRMLHGETDMRIMLVEAADGMGKSALMLRFRDLCRSREMPAVLIDLDRPGAGDYRDLVLEVRNQLGRDAFPSLTRVLDEPAAGRATDIAGEQATAPLVMVRKAGSNVVEDSRIHVGDDTEQVRALTRRRVTAAFVQDLSALANPERRIVFLFDSWELATSEVDRWLRDELLARLADGQLDNVVAVLAGRQTPTLDRGWDAIAIRSELGPFEEVVVEDYLRRRGVELDRSQIASVAEMSGGRPHMLARMVDLMMRQGTDPFFDDSASSMSRSAR